MKRRLFLTGPIGCGKSTAIANALGEKITQCGGFLTRRVRDAAGKPLSFYLVSPDGMRKATFLDCSGPRASVDLTVFGSLGVELLRSRGVEGAAPCILDEIGGMELLCPEFAAALEQVLQRDIPVIGVLKGEGPAGALMDAMGLGEEYTRAADSLRSRLRNDENTLLYECGKYDETALRLAAQWAEEYLHDEFL